MSMHRAAARTMVVLMLVAPAVLLGGCLSSIFEPPQRLGPPGMVMHGGVERLWLLVKQEEQKYVGSSSRHGMATRWETFYHFELRAHDPETAQPMWKKRLGTVHENRCGHSTQARIIGPDGDVVWLFLDGQPLALSAADGTVIADRARIEQVNPALKGLIPKDLKFYAFDGGLVITAADARRYRVNAAGYKAEPYPVKDEQAFARLAYMTHTWNGGYQTGDFLVRQGMLEGRWIGLHTDTEAAPVGDDRFGDHLKYPDRWEFPDRLLLMGAVQLDERGVTRWQDMIVAVSLRDGRVQTWNVTLERAEGAAKAGDGKSDAGK